MFEWFGDALTWLQTLAHDVVEAVLSWIASIWDGLWSWMGGFLVSLVPDDLIQWWNDQNFDPFLNGMEICAYILPIGPLLAIMGGAYAVAAVVRALRWLGGVSIFGSSVGS